MAIRLLFIDEELPSEEDFRSALPTPYMQFYVDAMRIDGEVDFEVVRGIEEAKAILSRDKIPFDVVSLDSMMPVRINDRYELDNRAGIELLTIIIKKMHPVGVILLSNVRPFVLTRDLPKDRGAISEIRVLEKIATEPFQFVRHVKELGVQS